VKSPLLSPVDAVLIGLGGALGSLARFSIGSLWESSFPYATLVLNLLGALLLALLHLHEHRLHPKGNYLYMVGFCGSFTTVSLFSHETVSLLMGGYGFQAALNLVLSVGSAFLLVSLLIKHCDTPGEERA